MNSGSMKYADWLAELIKADSVPPVPSDPISGAARGEGGQVRGALAAS